MYELLCHCLRDNSPCNRVAQDEEGDSTPKLLHCQARAAYEAGEARSVSVSVVIFAHLLASSVA